MHYLCWDIDGTLLLTNRAGADALIEAVQIRFGLANYKFTHSLAGLTDSEIIKEIIIGIKGRCTSADAASLLITYHTLLQRNLRTHQGRLMPNVTTTLNYIKDQAPTWQNGLLSGNTATGAKAKIDAYQLQGLFDYAHSAFGDLSEDRAELAKILYSRLVADNLVQSPADVIVIGDTPNDVRCAATIGARCAIILAGSEYHRDSFTQLEPCWILDKLPDNPAEFIHMLAS